jgi:hypothetical protein
MRATVTATLIGALLAGCYTCDLRVDGVCIAYTDELEPDTEERWRTVIERSTAYWGALPSALDGWTIVVHEDPFCYGMPDKAGCVYPGLNEIHLKPKPCDAWMLPHEIGHVVEPGGDPAHWAGGWDTVDRDEARLYLGCAWQAQYAGWPP